MVVPVAIGCRTAAEHAVDQKPSTQAPGRSMVGHCIERCPVHPMRHFACKPDDVMGGLNSSIAGQIKRARDHAATDADGAVEVGYVPEYEIPGHDRHVVAVLHQPTKIGIKTYQLP